MTARRGRVTHAYRGGMRALVRSLERRRRGGPRTAAGRPSRPWRVAAVVIALGAGLSGCASGAWGVTWVAGGQHVVVDGATVRGALWVAGGEVRLAPGSAVAGPVVTSGGVLVVDGLIAGPLAHLGGDLRLGPWAAVHGRLVAAAPFGQHPDALLRSPPTLVPGIPGAHLHPIARALALAFATAAAAAAWAGGRPAGLAAMADALVRRPWAAAIVGMATLAALAFAAWALALWFGAAIAAGLVLALGGAIALTGWASAGRAVTRALARGPLADFADRPVLLAAVGGFDAGLTVGLVGAIPAVGGPLVLLASLVPIGAVALGSWTRAADRRGHP